MKPQPVVSGCSAPTGFWPTPVLFLPSASVWRGSLYLVYLEEAGCLVGVIALGRGSSISAFLTEVLSSAVY